VATQSELRASANYGYGIAPVPVKQPDADATAYFQRMSDFQAQAELERVKRQTFLDGIEAKSRADLALANVNNQHQYLMALTSKPQAQAAPVAAPAFDLDRILLWISVIGAVWYLIKDIRGDAPIRQWNPRRAKADSRYRRMPMARIRKRYKHFG